MQRVSSLLYHQVTDPQILNPHHSHQLPFLSTSQQHPNDCDTQHVKERSHLSRVLANSLDPYFILSI